LRPLFSQLPLISEKKILNSLVTRAGIWYSGVSNVRDGVLDMGKGVLFSRFNSKAPRKAPLTLIIILCLVWLSLSGCSENGGGANDGIANPESNTESEFSISGQVIHNGTGLPGVTLKLSSPAGEKSATSAQDGSYSFVGLAKGDYVLSPSMAGCSFVPAKTHVAINGNIARVETLITAFLPRIWAGWYHSLALTSSRQLLAWGDNSSGQLGNGTNTGSNVPVNVSLPEGIEITAIAAGWGHSLALTSDGRVLAWGRNSDRQLGDGTINHRNVPVNLTLTQITAIAAGEAHSLALTSDGRVLAWGCHIMGQLGDGRGGVDDSDRVNVSLPAGTTVTAIAAGERFSLALTSDGRVLAWGEGAFGQLGAGIYACGLSTYPLFVSLPAGTTVTAIAAGANHCLALTSAGELLAWGLGSAGQLGHGTRDSSDIPVRVSLPAATRITAIAAGAFHSLALTSTGELLSWGVNVSGQLGNETNDMSTVPVNVSLPAGASISSIAAGQRYSLALTSTGEVLAWGLNSSGQLGDGTASNSNVPVKVLLPPME